MGLIKNVKRLVEKVISVTPIKRLQLKSLANHSVKEL